jgi:hypothetical protein
VDGDGEGDADGGAAEQPATATSVSVRTNERADDRPESAGMTILELALPMGLIGWRL